MRSARLSELTNRLALKAAVAQTVTQIITSYRDVLRAQEQLHIATEALSRSQQLLDVNRAMINAGRMAQFEIVQTEADYATQELGVQEAQNQLDAYRLELLQLLALDLESRIQAVETLDATPVQLSRVQALDTALEQQPAYLGQLIANEQAGINLAVARNNQLWDVSLVGEQARSVIVTLIERGDVRIVAGRAIRGSRSKFRLAISTVDRRWFVLR